MLRTRVAPNRAERSQHQKCFPNMSEAFNTGLEPAPFSQKQRINLLRERKQVEKVLDLENNSRQLVNNLTQKVDQSVERIKNLNFKKDQTTLSNSSGPSYSQKQKSLILSRLDTEIQLETKEKDNLKSRLEEAELNLARAELNRRTVDIQIKNLSEQEQKLADWQERRCQIRKQIADANNKRRDKTVENFVFQENERILANEKIENDKKLQAEIAKGKAKEFLKISQKQARVEKEYQNGQQELEREQKMTAILNLRQNIEKSRAGELKSEKNSKKEEFEEQRNHRT